MSRKNAVFSKTIFWTNSNPKIKLRNFLNRSKICTKSKQISLRVKKRKAENRNWIKIPKSRLKKCKEVMSIVSVS